ncbi:hypothetical protein GCM10009021_29270 [Halarchaeum nitratireducens]|uniref:Uncharacterized protein n=1 Tax=Halarchaeum nitratireducens TaxID=489913 RepID=A0A830GEG9_9EURY|nr:hypothetical protein GCM10009021_29270 [Halarchaeum nitratireducens]
MGVKPFVVEFIEALAEFVREGFQNGTVSLVQFCTDNKSHLTIIFHECVDAASRNGEGTAREVACNSVVANASFESRDIELVDEI